MKRVKDYIVRWAAREARCAPLYVLLIFRFPARQWYWALLDVQVNRVQLAPQASVELFTALSSKWWVPKAVQWWVNFQRACAYAALGQFAEATADFQGLARGPEIQAVRVERIRKAISVLERDPTRDGWFRMRELLAAEPSVPIPERVELIVSCAQRREQEAAAHEGDERVHALRRVYASFKSVQAIQGAPQELRKAAIRGEVSCALALGDWDTAYHTCRSQHSFMPELWRNTLALHTRHFPREVLPQYTDFARTLLNNDGASPVDAYCWLVNLSRSFRECGRLTASNAALDAASVHEPAFNSAPTTSRWNAVEPEDFEAKKPDRSPGPVVPLQSIVESIAPPNVPPDRLDELDRLLLGPEPSLQTVYDAVDMLCMAGLSKTDAIAVCAAIVVPRGLADEIKSVRDQLKGKLELEYAQQVIPAGFSVESKARVAELLVALYQTGKKGRAVREVLEEIGEYVMDVAPVEARIEQLVWLASISAARDCATNAESCLHAARAACMQYENPSVRLPLMLSLCQRIRGSILNERFGAFYKSVAMEGRVLATTTWINASGYYEQERNTFKDIQRKFEDMV